MAFISVVIPVYNVKEYLKQCIDSVLKQNYLNIEMILVDDGSTDGSEIICDEYAERHSNIKVIHTNNSGPSMARNTGIKESEGEYIIFLDSDDYWQPAMLGGLANHLQMNNVDIMVFDYTFYDDAKRKYVSKTVLKNSDIDGSRIMNGEEFLIEVLRNEPLYPWYAWRYIIKRSYFISSGFRFESGIKYEDVYLMYRVLLKARSVLFSKTIMLTYRINREGAITNTNFTNLNTEKNKLYVIGLNIRHAEKITISDELKKRLLNNFSCMYYSALIMCFGVRTNKDKEELLKELAKYLWVCKYTTNKQQKIIYALIKVFGIRNVAFLLHMRRICKGTVKMN